MLKNAVTMSGSYCSVIILVLISIQMSKKSLVMDRYYCFYFPPNMTNFIQPIDAGLGRTVLVRIKIRHCLDTWLMEEDNMEKWESKMTAGEHRVLWIDFVGAQCSQQCGSSMVDLTRYTIFHTRPPIHPQLGHTALSNFCLVQYVAIMYTPPPVFPSALFARTTY